MNELQRTLAFVAVAVVSVVAARFAGPSTPKQTAAITGVGEVIFVWVARRLSAKN